MRIGIDARLLAHRPGGIARYTAALANALTRIDTEDNFVLLVGRSERRQIVLGMRQRRLLTPPHHRLEQVVLSLELAFAGLDLLHSPDFIPPFRRRCPAVITVHDLAFLRYPELVTEDSRRYYGQLARAVHSAEGIIAVSEATRRDMAELLGLAPERVRVIHHAVDDGFRPLDNEAVEHYRRQRGLPRGFILWVGTLEPRKNLGTLLRALARVTEQRPALNPTLVLAGAPGWLYEDDLHLVDKLHLAENVVRLGPVPFEELPLLYNAARLFVFPSLYEGFGFPPLEAMACGIPVISSNSSAMPEVLGDAALLLDPLDVEGFAAAMVRMLEDEDLRQEMQRRGLARAAGFSWERTARQTLALYHEVARR